jgi:hypothetical protein
MSILHQPRWLQRKRDGIAQRLSLLQGSRSQCAWARELGVYQQTLGRYLNSDAVPHVDFLIVLREREKVDLNWLLTGELPL